MWFRKNATVSQGAGARVGDIFYVYYPNMGRVAHVGIVEREGDFIVTIEGNTNTTGARQGNGVYRLSSEGQWKSLLRASEVRQVLPIEAECRGKALPWRGCSTGAP